MDYGLGLRLRASGFGLQQPPFRRLLMTQNSKPETHYGAIWSELAASERAPARSQRALRRTDALLTGLQPEARNLNSAACARDYVRRARSASRPARFRSERTAADP